MNITRNLTLPMWDGLEYLARFEMDPDGTLRDLHCERPKPGTVCALIDRDLVTTATDDTDWQHRLTDTGWTALRTRNPELPHAWVNGRQYLRGITTLTLANCLDILTRCGALDASDRIKQNMIVSVLRERHASVDDAWRAWALDGVPDTTETAAVTAAARREMS